MKADENNKPSEEPKTPIRKKVKKNSQFNKDLSNSNTRFLGNFLTVECDKPSPNEPIQTSSTIFLNKTCSDTDLSVVKRRSVDISSVGSNAEFKNAMKMNQVLIERNKSVDYLQGMPAFGDLIFDPASPNQSNPNPNKDHLYKVLVIGDLGAGKTSIIKRYVHDFFSQHYRATIGVDFALKVVTWDSNTVIRLQLWDIAGQERYGNMTRVYYKGAVGAFIVFDVTRANTFESVTNWKADLDAKAQLPDGSRIPCVLLGNKCDQEKEGIVNYPSKMEEYCEENGFTSWFETSAKENINIEAAGDSLIKKMMQNDALNFEANKDKDQFQLTSNNHNRDNKKCYKC